MIQEVLTDLGGTGSVEFYGGDVTWVIRDKKVAIDRWHDTHKHSHGNTEGHHCEHRVAPGVDQD